MLYLIPLFFAIILRFYGVPYRDDIGSVVVEGIIAVALFADVVKIRFSILFHYHKLAVFSALSSYLFFFLVFWYTLPTEMWSLTAPLLLVASYDIRACPDLRFNAMVPPRVKQFLSLDGILRTILIALFIAPTLQLEWSGAVYSCLLGGGIGIVAIPILFLIRQNAFMFLIPLVTFFLSKYWFSEGIIATLTAGIVLGNLYRRGCTDIITLFGKYYGAFLVGAFFLFGMKFGSTLLHTITLEMILTTIFLVILIHAIGVSLSFFLVKMQWQTFLLGILGNIPGVLPFGLSTLIISPNQGFVPGILTLSLVFHIIYLPRLSTWYGNIFTGRDTCSKLEEHKPIVELPY